MKNDFVDQRITLMAQGRVDYTVEAFSISNEQYGMMMSIPTEEGCIYVTKQDAIDFFSPICFDMEGLVKKWREYADTMKNQQGTCGVNGNAYENCANELDQLLEMFRDAN